MEVGKTQKLGTWLECCFLFITEGIKASLCPDVERIHVLL